MKVSPLSESSFGNVAHSYVFAEYLRGVGTENNNECSELFKEYNKCLKVRESMNPSPQHLLANTLDQVALKERGIDKLLDEARDDNKENDAVYLGRKK